MEEKTTFGMRLKETREDFIMNQQEFSEMIGCTQSALSAYENDMKLPSLETAVQIAKATTTSLDWLTGLSENSQLNFEIKTYQDVIRCLLEFEKVLNIRMKSDFLEVSVYDENQKSMVRESKRSVRLLYFNDRELEQFMWDWDKMRTLLKKKFIDDEVYELRKEKTLRKLKNTKVSKSNFFEEDDEILF